MENSESVRERMFALVRQWEISGMSQKSFCEQHELAYHRFFYWRKRYRNAQHSSSNQGSAFIPLTITPDPAQTEVVMPGGIRIIFHQPVSASFLIQLTR